MEKRSMVKSQFLTCLLSLGAALPLATLHSQTPSAKPTILLAELTFDGTNANSIQPGDSAIARVATERLRGALREYDAFALTDSTRGLAEISGADIPGVPCTTSVQCVRNAGERVGARWVLTGTVSKISNPIWYLSGRLIDVASGRVILDDALELKGPPDEMVPRGAVSLARRVQKAVAPEADPTAGRSPPRTRTHRDRTGSR
jgi:hypothetical protein